MDQTPNECGFDRALEKSKKDKDNDRTWKACPQGPKNPSPHMTAGTGKADRESSIRKMQIKGRQKMVLTDLTKVYRSTA